MGGLFCAIYEEERPPDEIFLLFPDFLNKPLDLGSITCSLQMSLHKEPSPWVPVWPSDSFWFVIKGELRQFFICGLSLNLNLVLFLTLGRPRESLHFQFVFLSS